MNEGTKLVLTFLSLPFVMSAAIEFLPPWLSWPIGVIATIFWFGTIIQIGEYDSKKNKVDP